MRTVYLWNNCVYSTFVELVEQVKKLLTGKGKGQIATENDHLCFISLQCNLIWKHKTNQAIRKPMACWRHLRNSENISEQKFVTGLALWGQFKAKGIRSSWYIFGNRKQQAVIVTHHVWWPHNTDVRTAGWIHLLSLGVWFEGTGEEFFSVW